MPKQNDIKRKRAETLGAHRGATMAAMFATVPEGTDMKTWIKRSLIGVAVTALFAGGLAACGHRGADPNAGLQREPVDMAALVREVLA